MPMPRRMLIAAVSTSRRNRLSPESAMSCSVSPKEMPETLRTPTTRPAARSEEHTSELQSRSDLVCRLLLEKKKKECIVSIRLADNTSTFSSHSDLYCIHLMLIRMHKFFFSIRSLSFMIGIEWHADFTCIRC